MNAIVKLEPVTVLTTVARLRAALLCAAKGDVRFYLNGVYIESQGGTVRAVATDGHTLSAQILATDTGLPDRDAIIPRDMLEKLPKGKKALKEPATLTLSPMENGSVWLSLEAGGVAITGQAIDGRYPDWRRVIPTAEPSYQAGQFQPQLIQRHADAANLLGVQPFVIIHHNGPHESAAVTIPDTEYYGVVMPYKANPGEGFAAFTAAHRI